MKITGVPQGNQITMKTKTGAPDKVQYAWWNARSQEDLKNGILSTAAFLKEGQSYRYRQAAIYARLYGNHPLYSFVGSNLNKLDSMQGLPSDRPTFNLIQACVDTLVSRISQSRPAPIFLTDNSDYKERNLAKKLNNFIQGELYQTKAYDLTAKILRDALILGTGVLKIFETDDRRVGLERVLLTELLTDASESIYGTPRQLYQMKLVDRQVLADAFAGKKSAVEKATQAFPDSSADSSKSVSDMVMVVEGWRLKSGKNAKDGRHVIACSSGILLDEEFTKDKFPFAFLHYSDRLLGFWAQGLAEQQMGTQMEINSLLYTMSRAIKLVGVPRVFQEAGSKVSAAHHNNDIGVIITYSGMKPSYEVAPCLPQELYTQLDRLIERGFQSSGVSMMQASSAKPSGLNSGEAIRSYDDISTDRFASLSRKYDNVFIELAYAITDLAKDIAERDGKYQTVYPSKNAAKQIDLPDASLLQDPFVIQAFNMSSLPKDPAGRLQKVTDMVQAGMISLKEGRRLLDFPDLGQVETLANASEERIFQILDQIVEDGEYTPPDSFMDLALATELTVQYINLYGASKLEEEKMEQLRDFYAQLGALKQAAQPSAQPGAGMPPQANPEAAPTSPLIPNAPGGAQ